MSSCAGACKPFCCMCCLQHTVRLWSDGRRRGRNTFRGACLGVYSSGWPLLVLLVWLAVAHILGQQRASRELQLSYLARRLCSTSAGLVCCMQSGCSHCHMRVLAVIEVYCELYCEKQGRVERVRRCGCHSNILNVSSVVRQLAAGGTTTHWAGWHRCKIALVFIMCTEQSCFMELQPAFWS